MNIILLSGGSGKRLWPLSNDLRSKQFLKYFDNEKGEKESMLERTYRQIKKADDKANITVATSSLQLSVIKEQLGENVSISVEPARKDTFAAIVLACLYLKEKQQLNDEEPVIICPCDSYAADEYYLSLNELSLNISYDLANLYLIGINPTYPSAKYGYIIPENKDKLSKVMEFKEKPDEETAKEYINEGALWNGGVFGFKLKYIIDKAHELFEFKDYEDFYNKYENLDSVSFDYAVVEKETDICVLKYEGEWKDLGTWNTLTEEMNETIIGKGMMSDNCINSNIINETDVPVIAMGLKDIIISITKDGILVTTKKDSSYIKPYVDKID